MKTVTINLYSFDELSEEAKQAVIDREKKDRERQGFDDLWQYERLDTFKAMVDLFDLKTPRSMDRYSDVVRWNYKKIFSLSGARLVSWINNNLYSVLYERKTYNRLGKKRRSKVFFTQTCCPFSGVCYDDIVLQPIRDYLKNPAGDLQDLMYDCFHALDKAREQEESYYFSNEGIKEDIESGCRGFDPEDLYLEDGTNAENLKSLIDLETMEA